MASTVPPARIVLPPISSFMPDDRFAEIFCINRKPQSPEPVDALESSGPYKIDDDLSIFKAIRSFYGDTFSGTVPWSFWKTYRQLTGSNRSTSSLYHHWNGSIQRKYRQFLRQKNLDACIKMIEQERENGPVEVPLPLTHNWSQPCAVTVNQMFPTTRHVNPSSSYVHSC